jgi:hypothetical protein
MKVDENMGDRPTSQSAPKNPDVHEQVLGAEQVPLTQGLTQIAIESKTKTFKK